MSLLKQKLTQKEFSKRADEILQALTLEVRPFKDEGEDVRRIRLERAAEDPFFFFRTYLPHYFPISFAPFHYELVAALENLPKDSVVVPVCVVAPREFAKTTITSFGYSIHQISFKKRHFLIDHHRLRHGRPAIVCQRRAEKKMTLIWSTGAPPLQLGRRG